MCSLSPGHDVKAGRLHQGAVRAHVVAAEIRAGAQPVWLEAARVPFRAHVGDKQTAGAEPAGNPVQQRGALSPNGRWLNAYSDGPRRLTLAWLMTEDTYVRLG